MTIIDSSVWIDYLAGRITPQTDWLDRHASEQPCGLTDLILYEVLQGVRNEDRIRTIQTQLEAFRVWPNASREIAIQAARNYRSLRRRGITIRSGMDCLIATFCVESGHVLLHNDRDFHPFEQHLGLKVFHP